MERAVKEEECQRSAPGSAARAQLEHSPPTHRHISRCWASNFLSSLTSEPGCDHQPCWTLLNAFVLWRFGGPCGYLPRSWLADEVVRLNCCSRYFPRKAAKPATTAISMQAARMIQVKTGLESKCLVTLGITRREEKQRGVFV